MDTADPQTSHLVDRQWSTLRQDSTSDRVENDNCSYLEPLFIPMAKPFVSSVPQKQRVIGRQSRSPSQALPGSLLYTCAK